MDAEDAGAQMGVFNVSAPRSKIGPIIKTQLR